jgi:gluconate 2-dehydrogenase gamma chain
MSRQDEVSPPRRVFMLRSLATGAVLPTAALFGGGSAALTSTSASATQATAVSTEAEPGYLSFGPSEGAFVEALMNHMCPRDDLTTNGVDCGLAAYIDRQLAGGFGQGERLYMAGPWPTGKPQHGYQSPLLPDAAFKLGIARVNEICKTRFSRTFDGLSPSDAENVLQTVSAGRAVPHATWLKDWFDDLVYPLFTEACFADPLYGGNRGKVFWAAIGYPGLPATHARDIVDYRGKPYPDATNPKSIADFS